MLEGYEVSHIFYLPAILLGGLAEMEHMNVSCGGRARSEAKLSSFVPIGDAWNSASTIQKTLIAKVLVFTDE